MKRLLLALFLAVPMPAYSANLCLTLDLAPGFSTCATPSNADVTGKFLPAYKPLCDATKGSSCSNAEVWDYFATNSLRGVHSYVEKTLTDTAKGAVAPVTITGFPQ
jgi:hypothetical protein